MKYRWPPPTTTDDFISISGSQHTASATFDIMESTATEAGFEVHDTKPKFISAARDFECLRIIIDFNLKQLRISEDRICEIREDLSVWVNKSCQKKK